MSTDCFNKLDPPTQKQYKEKLEIIGNIDPHSVPDSHFSVKICDFPSICYPNIINYRRPIILCLAQARFLLMT